MESQLACYCTASCAVARSSRSSRSVGFDSFEFNNKALSDIFNNRRPPEVKQLLKAIVGSSECPCAPERNGIIVT